MKLAELLEKTKDHCTDYTGCKIVHPKHKITDYWNLEDYAVSSASGYLIYLVPRSTTKTHE